MFRKVAFTLLFSAGLLGVSAVSGFAQEDRTDRQIRREILMLPYYGVFDAISYQRSGSSVTLSGYVVRPSTKSDAEYAVKDVDGVDRVVNNIEVLPVSPSDDRIRLRVLQTLINRGGLYRYFLGANPAIRIIVNRGRVTLEGFADSAGDAQRAYILARGVPGTFGVTNNLQVPSAPR